MCVSVWMFAHQYSCTRGPEGTGAPRSRFTGSSEPMWVPETQFRSSGRADALLTTESSALAPKVKEFCFSWDNASLCSTDWTWTLSVEQAGLKLRDLPASPSWVLKLNVCTTMADLDFNFLNYYLYLKSKGFSSDVEIGKRRSASHTSTYIHICITFCARADFILYLVLT